ncbi:MAG: hypothetical protein KAS32_31375 [Candidatus Peribacteraceae bacterium]|nr:hypothetical protein [Candidatus Peribacteraceae bacterium]
MNEDKSLKTSTDIVASCMLMSIIVSIMAYFGMATEYLNSMSLESGIIAMTTILVMGTLAIAHYRLRLRNLKGER